ncbi:MAG: 5'-nucleotidase C-terminal domain-containing protein [Erysipelotrichaceae bacterium]|nr:5'-nucleotidase C-terminal domain-containing protein [Erysipelotrichaceae bacterium]
MKRIISTLVLLLCVLLAASGCKSLKPREDIYIFFTSDVHCGVNENFNYAKLKALVDDTKAEHQYVSLVDLGDYIQGGTYGTLSQGSIIIELMNELNYDVVTYGNHEFDYGMDRLRELQAMMKFKTVLSNARYSGKGESVFKDVPEYVLIDYGPVTVAYLGILTPSTITSSTPGFFKEDGEFVYDFYGGDNGNELFTKVQSVVDEVRKKGADYVVALAHMGSVTENQPYDSISLISHTSGIDVVLDGHSHSEISGVRYPNSKAEDVLMISAGTKMQNVGELIIGKDGTIESLLVSEYEREDETSKAAIEKADAEMAGILSQKVGELPFALTIADENGKRLVRTRETNLADFVCDATRALMDTDIALYNGGGIRKTIEAGEVTYGDLLNVMPFTNVLSSIRCTGQQILDVLELGSRNTQPVTLFEDNPVGENGGFVQVSGLKYTINTSVQSAVQLDDNGLFTGVGDKRRVSDVYVLKDGNWVELDPEAYYTVSSNRYFLLEGGDGNTVFDGCEVLIDQGPVDLQSLIEYMNSLETIPESYRQPQGRITVK